MVLRPRAMPLVTVVFGVDALIRIYACGDTNMLPALYIIRLPLILMLPLLLAASVTVGPTLTVLLERTRREIGGAITGRRWWLAAEKTQ